MTVAELEEYFDYNTENLENAHKSEMKEFQKYYLSQIAQNEQRRQLEVKSVDESLIFEPCHEVILRKLILQTSMRSHPMGLNVWFLLNPSSTSIIHVIRAVSPEPSLVA